MAKVALEEADEGDKVEAGAEDQIIYSLDEMEMFQRQEEEQLKGKVQGPEINSAEMVQSAQDQEDYNAKLVLDSYWAFVNENPRDFNGWTYLLQHVETIDILDDIKKAYNAFLPKYPYCYAYWMRYADVQKRHNNWSTALAILTRGIEAIPLSTELWISYLELYLRIYRSTNDFDATFTSHCERAVQTVGLGNNLGSMKSTFSTLLNLRYSQF